MLLLVLAFGGALIGLFVNLLWASIDALLGTSTITIEAGLGVLGVCIVLVEIFGCGAVLYDFMRE